MDATVNEQQDAPDWLQIAKDAFTSSTTYFDANWRSSFERNISLFQSKHPSGSKYNSDAFKKRSRLFRPKTKSVVRKNEAAAAAAFFANVDVVDIGPENDADPIQVASAELMGEVINYRLTRTIPWYLLLLGALQEAQVIGIVASYQYWKYRERVNVGYEPVLDDIGQPLRDELGQPYGQAVESVEVLQDEPCIELIPVENIRFDPGADWTDIVGTSPYLIRMVPMYVDSVRQQMKAGASKTGASAWREYSEDEIRVAMADYDTTRQKRESGRQDPLAENEAPLKAFDIVWCHENFVRLDGEDVVYWTLGTTKMLTDPAPLAEVYFTGKRPIVIGSAVLEAHKAVPESLVAIGAELQKEVNETVNQRRDNVALVLNKRWIAKRNAQVDVESLLKNVPGAVTLANAIDDVREVNWPDVTGSAYQEQDRLNVDFDELTGNFSQGSVMTNRKLNETVGGMQMMGGSANQMTEYLIRTFVETWVEPVLNQLVALEQQYETNETILMVAANGKNLAPAVIQELVNRWHNSPMTVNVNVGMGATDPRTKLQKFTLALQAYSGAMSTMPDADPDAIRKEIFGLAGYRDGSRFFKGETPQNAQLQQQMQEMQQAMHEMGKKLAEQELALKNKHGELSIQAFDAETKRIAATRQNGGHTELDAVSAIADAGLKSAQIDLTQAQAAKTLVEAAIAPSQAMVRQARDVN